MTKAAITTEINEIEERIYALSSVAVHSVTTDHDAKCDTINTMLKEYQARHRYLISRKEFMVHFEGGGWNTCYGVTKEEAFDNACLEFNTEVTPDGHDFHGHVGMKVRSVSLATSEGIASAMRLFY
jgi:hypothetical protein